MRSSEIFDFIRRRFKTDCHWMDGNCYYFASILCARFPYLEIVYLPIQGHFMTYDRKENVLYDFDGLHAISHVAQTDNFITIKDLANQDPTWFSRIFRDCIY